MVEIFLVLLVLGGIGFALWSSGTLDRGRRGRH